MPPRDPHEHDVFADSYGDLARGVNALRVGVNNDFGEHFRMVAVPSASRVGRVKDGVVETIDGGVAHALVTELIHSILNVQRNLFFRGMVGGTSILPKSGFFLFDEMK